MRGTHHIFLGVTATAAVFLGGDISWNPAYLALGGLAALLPDLDARRSKLSRYPALRQISFTLFYLLGHRGLLHSALGLIALAAAGWWLLGSGALSTTTEKVWLAVVLGYGSHLLADSLTVSGVRWLYPRRARLRLLPKKWCVVTGSWQEEWLVIVLIATTVGWLAA